MNEIPIKKSNDQHASKIMWYVVESKKTPQLNALYCLLTIIH